MPRKKTNTDTKEKKEVKASFPVELTKDNATKKAYSEEVLELLKKEGWK